MTVSWPDEATQQLCTPLALVCSEDCSAVWGHCLTLPMSQEHNMAAAAAMPILMKARLTDNAERHCTYPRLKRLASNGLCKTSLSSPPHLLCRTSFDCAKAWLSSE